MPNVTTLRRSRAQAWAMGLLAVALAGSALVGAAQADHDGPDTDSLTYEPHAGWDAPARSPGPLAPTTGALMGVHSHDDDDLEPGEQGVSKLEQAMGRTMDINNRYYGDFEEFAEEGEMSWLEHWDIDLGRIPLVGWGCTNSDKVINGSLDTVIRKTAQVMKAFGHQFFMRYCWEMDGSRKQGEVKGYKKFIAAWQRMYTIFKEEQANNVIWVWTPNAAGFKDQRSFSHNEPPGPYFYPGDDYVDWIAADGYNWGVSDRNQGDRWRHAIEIFDEFMVFARQHPKPIMIGEYGAQEQPKDPAAKEQWMRVAHETFMDKPRTPECQWCGVYKDVAAVVYFDVDYGPHGDWRIMSSPGSQASYKAAADDPWFHQIDTLTSWAPRANRKPVSQSAQPYTPPPSQPAPASSPEPSSGTAEEPAPESADGSSSPQPPSGSADSSAPAQPSSGPAPADDSATPADDSAKPADDSAKPADDSAKPADDSAKPDDDSAKPDDDSAKPDDEPAKPDDEPAKPDDEPAKPDDEPAKPDDDSATPDDSAKAADDSGKPSADDPQPGATQQRPQEPATAERKTRAKTRDR